MTISRGKLIISKQGYLCVFFGPLIELQVVWLNSVQFRYLKRQ